MSVFLSYATPVPADLAVRLNTSGSEPFATIDLDEHGRAYLTVRTPADADSLIRAACNAKLLLEEAAAPPAEAKAPAWGGVL